MSEKLYQCSIIFRPARLLQRARPSRTRPVGRRSARGGVSEQKVVVLDQLVEPRLEVWVAHLRVHVFHLKATHAICVVHFGFEPLAPRLRVTLELRTRLEGVDACRERRAPRVQKLLRRVHAVARIRRRLERALQLVRELAQLAHDRVHARARRALLRLRRFLRRRLLLRLRGVIAPALPAPAQSEAAGEGHRRGCQSSTHPCSTGLTERRYDVAKCENESQTARVEGKSKKAKGKSEDALRARNSLFNFRLLL